MISPVTSHSEVQEESHCRVQDPPQQRLDSGIEKYGTNDHGIRRSQRSAERSGREADGGLHMSSHRYFGARPCCDLATRSRTLYLSRAKIGSQCSSLIM